MEARFLQQLKKGVLEMLVLELICIRPTYGYELLAQLKSASDGLFALKEGTLYPILYRLEDEGLIESTWKQGEGRSTPKKVYVATEAGREERTQRHGIWNEFIGSVSRIYEGWYTNAEDGK